MTPKDLYDACEMMLADGWGYIYGTAGVFWTEARQKAATGEMARKYGERWINHMVADCSGVMVYIWKKHGLTIPHGSNSIARLSVGRIQTAPSPGYAAFKRRSGDNWPDGIDYYHIGIVAEDGEHVYESKGTQAGFVVSDAKEWDCFAPFKAVTYEKGEQGMLYRAVVETESGPLNMRSGPGKTYGVVAKLQRGEPVDVIQTFTEADTGERWAFVDADGDQGYCALKYLKKIEPQEQPEEEPEAPKQTVLRCASNGVTIALVGEWEIYKGE